VVTPFEKKIFFSLFSGKKILFSSGHHFLKENINWEICFSFGESPAQNDKINKCFLLKIK